MKLWKSSLIRCGLVAVYVAFSGIFASAQDAENGKNVPVRYLMANDMSIATGQPSLVTMGQVPVWSLSGGTVGQSVSGVVPGFSAEFPGVKVEIVVTTEDSGTSTELEDVYRVHLSQIAENGALAVRRVQGDAVRTALTEKPHMTRTIVLESYYAIQPELPIVVRIQREPGDPANTYKRPDGLIMVRVIPQSALPEPFLVQDVEGYNSWPMMQAVGDKLVCTYSRGSGHTIGEGIRAVYARTSSDGGKTWTPETLVANTPNYGDVAIGKGLDSTGAMLLWVRRVGKNTEHDLYRTTDGVEWTRIATPELEVMPIQITDVFSVPNVGLMALWFAGNYGDMGPCHSWGTVVSTDDGKTWTQHVVEENLEKTEWPTEPSAVYLGDGRILAVARSEIGDKTTIQSQFQMISTDFGKTWTRTRTNITDVLASSPSLIWDAKTGLVSNYYYHRGRGVVRTRIVAPDDVFHNSLNWSVSKAVALGSDVTFDAGNVNATRIGDTHYLTFYSGAGKNTSVYVSAVPAPQEK